MSPIAIIEDEKKLADTLREGMEAEGYSVTLLYDGLEGESALLKNKSGYSLAIIDLMLPHKNGFEICASLRKEGCTFPILILTAKDSVEDKVKALDAGADDFLSKPFSFDELMARVRALLRRAEGHVTQSISVGDLSIYRDTRNILRGNTEIALTPTEFDILLLLITHPGKVFSRENISMELWDTKETSLSNVVDVHISNLRKKIDEGHAKKIIRTIRGLGYTVKT